MIVTETEAKARKLCPFLAPALDTRSSRSLCEGSHCMAWRWADPQMNVRPTGPLADLPDAYRSQDNIEPCGYCGAAGPIPSWGLKGDRP